MAAIKQALISVSDKSGVLEFAQGLNELGVRILSTGGTAKLLAPTGYYSKGEVSGEGFFDATGMAGLIAFATANPIVAAACSLTAGSGAVSVLASTTVAALSYDVKVAMNDGVKLSFKATLSG